MKKFVNHVDHVVWICRPENLLSHVRTLESVTEAKLERLERRDIGLMIYLSWEAGLEVVSPMEDMTSFNAPLHEHLNQRGEGLYAVVFGVKDMEKHEERLEALGFQLGPRTDESTNSPWLHKRVLRERIVGNVINNCFILGDIDYTEGVVKFEDAAT